MKDTGAEVMRRRDELYDGKPIMKKVATMVIKNKIKVKPLKPAKPRKW